MLFSGVDRPLSFIERPSGDKEAFEEKVRRRPLPTYVGVFNMRQTPFMLVSADKIHRPQTQNVAILLELVLNLRVRHRLRC